MIRPVTTSIDAEACIGCGHCITTCPSDTLTLVDGKATVSGQESIGCDHCMSVCPTDAVTVGFVDENALAFSTLENTETYVKPGDYDTEGLVRLMRSRRSCRAYKEKPVSREILEDLVRIGISAPSGSNCQMWQFTVLPERESVLKLGRAVLRFFKKLNRMVEKRGVRLMSRLFMKGVLNAYYENYYEKVGEAVREFERGGRDRLFHGAPAAIVISVEKGSSTPAADANLAAQNILLAAHSMGLGSCLIGFAVEAMSRDSRIAAELGIPKNEHIHAVIALGYPAEPFRRVCGRKRVVPRFVTP